MFHTTIVSCTRSMSSAALWKFSSSRLQKQIKAAPVPNHMLWVVVVFPHPAFPSRDGASGGVSASSLGAKQLWGLFHSSLSPARNDQALFPESSLTHLSFHCWQTVQMTASLGLGFMSVSKALVIPILNGTLSSLRSEGTLQHKPPHRANIRAGINSCQPVLGDNLFTKVAFAPLRLTPPGTILSQQGSICLSQATSQLAATAAFSGIVNQEMLLAISTK